MSEAIYAVNEFIFNVLKIDKFTVANAKDNIGSRRVKEKTGAIYLRDEHVKNHSGDIGEVWEVTKESWGKVKNEG